MFFKKEKSVSFVSRVVEKKKDVHKRIEYPNQQVYHNISKNVFFLKKNEAKFSPLSLHHQTSERTIYILIKEDEQVQENRPVEL